ncbi:MAG: flagellar assembly protein FliW [Acidimicrobiales bacterium]
MSQLATSPLVLARIVLPAGIPAFPDLRELRCEPWGDEDSPLVVLSSDAPAVRLVAAWPAALFPSYRPEIPSQVRTWLRLPEGGELLLVIVTLGASPAEATANLLAPLVVDPASGLGHQTILDTADWSALTPIAAG